MKLLHVVPTYLPAARYGGTIVSVHGLCRALVRRGHDVSVYTTNVDGPSVSPVPVGVPVDVDGVKVTYFASPFPRLYWSPAMGEALKRSAAGFDVLHAHSIFLWPTLAAARAARRAGKPYLVAPRGMLVPELVARKSRFVKTAWIALVERGNLERASGLHFTSELEAAEAARFGFRLPHAFVVPNGVELAPAAGAPSDEARRLASRENLVLFLGRVNWKKGIDRLLRALVSAPSANLAVVGNDEENYRPQLERLSRELGLGSRVTFSGALYGADKRVLFERARAFVLPSDSENFGNAALEAMAAGCPVILTPGVGLAEEVRRAGAGIVAEPQPDSLAAAIRALVDDPAARERMAAAARKAASAFSWDAVAAKMEAAYREVAR